MFMNRFFVNLGAIFNPFKNSSTLIVEVPDPVILATEQIAIWPQLPEAFVPAL